MDSIADTSPRQLARMAGALYLINILGGAFAIGIAQVFFTFDLITIGYLVLRSGFVPRVIGVLLAIAGLAYLIYSLANLLAPAFAGNLVPWIQLPSLLGEGSLCLWLLVVGLNAPRWNERANAAIRVSSTQRAALA